MKKALFFLCCAASLVFYGTAEAADPAVRPLMAEGGQRQIGKPGRGLPVPLVL